MFKCNYCTNEYNSFNGLAKHSSRAHGISGMELYMVVHKLTEIPKCKCGCNEKLNFQLGKFGEYIRGHKARVSGGFYSEKGAANSAQTRREKFASGELQQWNKGKKYTETQLESIQKAAQNPERRKKISEKLSGKRKSPEHIAKIKADRQKYWNDTENRDKQRIRRVDYMNKYLVKAETKLETKFKSILDFLNIQYIFQYAVNGYNYDFYIPEKNILIEVDGDQWHCNPALGIEPIHKSQKHTVEHDKIKNKNAEDNGYQLVRFWENDIQEKRLECIEKLMEIVKNDIYY